MELENFWREVGWKTGVGEGMLDEWGSSLSKWKVIVEGPLWEAGETENTGEEGGEIVGEKRQRKWKERMIKKGERNIETEDELKREEGVWPQARSP